MFGDKLATANQRITALTALLAVAGLNASADAELPTPDAFRATLEQNKKNAIDGATAKLNETIGSLGALGAAYTSGLAAAGVKVGVLKSEDFQVKEGAKEGDLTGAATAIKTAVETAITAKSARVIAASGHSDALPLAPSDTVPSESAKDAEPATLEEFKTALNGFKDAGARQIYFRKHKAKFIR